MNEEKERTLSESNPTKDGQRRLLSKDERKELLKQLERASSRSESAEAVLARVDQAIHAGNLEQAENFLLHLEATVPDLAGLGMVKDKLREAQRGAKHQANVRAAEDILSRYIQQRKKKLAEFAVQTLADLEPHHHRLADYRVWVAELDQEVAFHQRLETIVATGKEALFAGDIESASRRVADLRKLDAESPMVEAFAAEVEFAQRGLEEGEGIEKSKERLEDFLTQGQMKEAEAELEQLARTAVPKITLDFLRKRLEGIQSDQEVRSRLAVLERQFRERLNRGDWDGAREVAQQAGEQKAKPGRTAEMFNEVDRREASLRRRQSITQGLAMLQKFIAEGKRAEAELALKVLQSLNLEADRFHDLEQKVRNL